MPATAVSLSLGGAGLLLGAERPGGGEVEVRLTGSPGAAELALPMSVMRRAPGEEPGSLLLGLRATSAAAQAAMRSAIFSALSMPSGARSGGRVAVAADAVWSAPVGRQSGSGELLDVGLGGGKVRGVDLPPVGTRLILGVHSVDVGEMIAVPARVVWIRAAGPSALAGLAFEGGAAAPAAVRTLLEGLLFTPRPQLSLPAPRPAGTRIGNFVLGDRLVGGRSTEVYRARPLDPEADAAGAQEVAVRRFAGEPGDLDIWGERFLDASVIGSTLFENPRVLRVFDTVRDRGECWLVTELFEGTSLDHLVGAHSQRGTRLPLKTVLDVAQEVLAALHHCHCHATDADRLPLEVVHGDLRPSNVLVGPRGEVKLTGFGAAHKGLAPLAARPPPDRLGYLAPELFRSGGGATRATDLYQLGVLLYEAVAGIAPFAATGPEHLEKLVSAGPVAPSRHNPEVPGALDELLLRALAASPEARPASALEFLRALAAARAGLVSTAVARARRPDAPPVPAPSDGGAPPGEVTAEALVEKLGKPPEPSGLHLWKPVRRGLERGDRLGRYEIVDKLAKGGMAEVHFAREVGPDAARRPVVLKTILPAQTADLESVKLFLNEARVAALLSHPNIVELYDFGFDRGRPYLAMEWLDGVTLSQLHAVLKRQGKRLPPPLAARVVAECAAALAYAHGRKGADGRQLDIVHRDMSARNVHVSYDGRVKVLDFGIAKFRGSADLTATGMVRGTAGYVSPEQVREEPATGASDVWALGVNLYLLLTDVSPFERGNFAATMMAILNHRQPAAHTLEPGVPPALSRVCERALEKSPERRYGSAALMRTELEEFLTGQAAGAAELSAFVRSVLPADAAQRQALEQLLAVAPAGGLAPEVAPARGVGATPAGAAEALGRVPGSGAEPAAGAPVPRDPGGLHYPAVSEEATLPEVRAPVPLGASATDRSDTVPRTDPRELGAVDPPTTVVREQGRRRAWPWLAGALLGAGVLGLALTQGAPRPSLVVVQPSAGESMAQAPDAGTAELVAQRPVGADARKEPAGADAGAPTTEVAADAGGSAAAAEVATDAGAPDEPVPSPAPTGTRLACNVSCSVELDGRPLGRAPVWATDLVGRPHRLQFVADTPHGRAVKEVRVKAGPAAPEKIEATFRTGKLTVLSSKRAEVLVLGKRVGSTPVRGLTLIEGQHQVLVLHPKLGKRQQTVTIRPGVLTTARFDLGSR